MHDVSLVLAPYRPPEPGRRRRRRLGPTRMPYPQAIGTVRFVSGLMNESSSITCTPDERRVHHQRCPREAPTDDPQDRARERIDEIDVSPTLIAQIGELTGQLSAASKQADEYLSALQRERRVPQLQAADRRGARSAISGSRVTT
jgi:hypothetical protein